MYMLEAYPQYINLHSFKIIVNNEALNAYEEKGGKLNVKNNKYIKELITRYHREIYGNNFPILPFLL